MARIAVAATAPFGADVLERLAQQHDVALLFTRPDKPRGRGRNLQPTSAKEVAERLGIPLDPDRNFHTVAGLVLAKFGPIPEVGECDEIHGWRFEVVDLDGRRIDKLLVSRIAPTHRVRA